MLTHYSPLKVAEQFRLLETLHPGRIDLGIGRAPGSDGRTALALRRGAEAPAERARAGPLGGGRGRAASPTRSPTSSGS